MAEKISKAAATKAAKKETAKTVKAAEVAKAPAKKACAKKAACAVVYVDDKNAGFKAGAVYNALNEAQKALTVAEVAKAAGITVEEAYLGLGWLLREGKVAAGDDNKVALA